MAVKPLTVRFGLLGVLEVVDGTGAAWKVPAAKQRVILAALLLGRGRTVSAASLAEALWDESPPPNEPTVLRNYVARLRRVLGPVGPRIVGHPPGWAVELRGPEEFDVIEVDRLRLAARAEADAGNWKHASALLTTALSKWRGEPLVDIPSTALWHREAGMLAELRVGLTEARVDADLRLGRHHELVAELRQLVAEHPLRERIRVQLMTACFRCGQQAAALEAYRDAYQTLADELGLEPGRELQQIHRQILSGDLTLAAEVPAAASIHHAAVPSDPDASSSSPRPERSAPHLRTISNLEREISAQPGPRSVTRQLPAALRYFAGRRSELTLLDSQQRKTAPAGGVVISGMAGVGKTALALHWAHRVAGEFPDGQLYADLGGFGPSGAPLKPAVALRGFLYALGMPADRIPRSLEALSGLYRSLVAGRSMLVVLDNARNVEQVRPLLPGSPGCLVLVTSRTPLTGLAVSGHADLLSLDVLSDAEARELLAVRLGADAVARESDAVSELIGFCGGLPLAVAIAAARAAAHPSFPIAALNAELRDAARRLDGLDAGDAASSVRTVVSWSYQQLADLPARMLRLLSVHPGPSITAAAAASMVGSPLRQARHALRALADVNLITQNRPGRYGLHDLLRAFAAEQAQADRDVDDRRAAIGRMLDHYLHTVNTSKLLTLWECAPIAVAPPQPNVLPESLADQEQALAWLDAEHAVLVRLTSLAADTGFHTHAWQLASALAPFFQMRGHLHDLVATQRIALAAARRLDDQEAQASIRCQLGSASSQAGQFRQARAQLERAFKLYKALGDENGQAQACISIGEAWSRQCRDREALDRTLDAVRPWPTDSPPPRKAITPVTRAVALNNLGWYHARLGELDQARTLCDQALQLFRDMRNPYGQAITRDSLGFIYHQLGNHDLAAVHYRLAADQYRQLGDFRNLADTLARLAESHEAAGDIAAARDAWPQAIALLDGMRHPDAQNRRDRLRQLDSLSGSTDSPAPCRREPKADPGRDA